MVVKKLLEDTFENLKNETRELTIGTIKKGFSEITRIKKTESINVNNQVEKNLPKSHTEIDPKQLENTYKDQDQQKLIQTRNNLFNLVKSDQENYLAKQKKQKQEEYQAEMINTQQKQKEQNENSHELIIPKGKIRRNIFGGGKKTSNFENQISKGK